MWMGDAPITLIMMTNISIPIKFQLTQSVSIIQRTDSNQISAWWQVTLTHIYVPFSPAYIYIFTYDTHYKPLFPLPTRPSLLQLLVPDPFHEESTMSFHAISSSNRFPSSHPFFTSNWHIYIYSPKQQYPTSIDEPSYFGRLKQLLVTVIIRYICIYANLWTNGWKSINLIKIWKTLEI